MFLKIIRALHTHITASELSIKTVRAYSGEFNDLTKLRDLLPGVFTYFRRGIPNEEGITEIDCRVVTESVVFDKSSNEAANLQLSSDLAEYFTKNAQFTYEGEYYRFVLDTNTGYPDIFVETRLLSDRYTIIDIRVKIQLLK